MRRPRDFPKDEPYAVARDHGTFVGPITLKGGSMEAIETADQGLSGTQVIRPN